MSNIRLPRYVLPLSIIGTLGGAVVLIKDLRGGSRYTGDEKLLGKTVIVTGANSGLGKETAKELAKRGGRIIMACRDLAKCETARAEVIEYSFNKNVECKKLDLASLKSVRAFTEEIKKNEKRLDILINNAGVMRCPKTLTEDGFEMQLGTNHLGHFALTNLLLDKLKECAPSRIINLSGVVHARGYIAFKDLNHSKRYDPIEAYAQSKLAVMLFNKELAERLKGTQVNTYVVNPGVCYTELPRHMGMHSSKISGYILAPLWWMFFKTPLQGIQTTLYCALDPDLEDESGLYYVEMDSYKPAENALDEDTAKRLWAVSEKWTRLT